MDFDDLTDAERTAFAHCRQAVLGINGPLRLDCGIDLGPYRVAYQTYGRLNAAKSNAVLICHALTGDQFVAETHPVTGKPGWWETLVGPGKVLDPARYFIICVNVLGGCMGSTGPLGREPASGQPWNLRFPVVTIGDMVRAQAALLDHLGIPDLFCVIGGSSQAIMADPEWKGGDYRLHRTVPARGLAVARMTAHITYLSEQALQRKFGRALQNRNTVGFGFDADFQVESYLRHQGSSFVDRFDANSYLYITRAMDYFDLADAHGGVLANAFHGSPTRFCLMSFTSDWLFPTRESRDLVHALNAAAANVSFVEIDSDKGHDAFLLDEPEMFRTLAGFLKGAAAARGLTEVS